MTPPNAQLAQLTKDFWHWRARTQSDSFDDIPRVDRPAGWTSDWSAAAVAARRSRLDGFSRRYQALDLGDESVPVRVNGRLLESALARVHWELDLLSGWRRNPCFYIDQSLIPVFNLLLPPPPFDGARAAAIIENLANVPRVLAQARTNLLGHAAEPFATQALKLLAESAERLEEAMASLAPLLPQLHARALPTVTQEAARQLTAFQDWLQDQDHPGEAAVGEQALNFFLHKVALLPYTPQQMRVMARQEHHRSVAAEAIARRQSRRSQQRSAPQEQNYIGLQHSQERAVRRFYAEQGILRLPEDLRHYRFEPVPSYLEPLTWLGVPHYITSQASAGEDAVRYVRAPEPGLSYFQQAKVLDPRTGIVHEGVHAHQLAWSWQHPDPARRNFYDSAPNEGLAFYHEELMLLSGLFADSPASAVFMANSMRLRALRVETDLGLAAGDLTLGEAADLLVTMVPLDGETAWQEAVFFAGNPGQGLSYQIGKLQILDLLSASERELDDFDLQAFHERLWREGNIPIALQRWEFLGLRDHLDEADRLAGAGRPLR
ncbi:DUF885 family protein [Actinomadura syzygii]|uniref:DUF885 domain-containing protein n=1 Tax=Actinomadura syzygii TaxID=1427538 RepID=A0A5D0TQJ8_9ACTN|nr:DUF885 family protein [Actinomadura syzygii]TYC07562.1 DUF885 domain-containing protein [Actinomadura syzygii]